MRAFSPDKRLHRRFEEVVRGALAAGSARVSEMVASLPSPLQNRFHQAKALYRFLSNPRVEAEALLDRVYQESATALEGEEVLVLLDLSPVAKPYARALEGIARVGKDRRPGYELLTALGLDPAGRLALGYAHLVAYGERGFASLPKEVEGAIEAARERLGGVGRRLVYVADRGFDDRKVFGQVLALGEEFVVRVYRDRKLGEGGSLAKVASSLALPCGEEVELRVGGRYQRVRLHFGWREVEVEGRRLHLVVCRVPALGRRGEWWLLTSLPVRGREEAARVVEAYRRRWEVERFFRLLKTGLGLETFQVRGLARIRKVVAVLLGLAVFLWEVERLGDPFKGFLLQLGGKLGLPSERDGPYLLLRGLVRLLNYEVTQELLKQAKGGRGRSFG